MGGQSGSSDPFHLGMCQVEFSHFSAENHVVGRRFGVKDDFPTPSSELSLLILMDEM